MKWIFLQYTINSTPSERLRAPTPVPVGTLLTSAVEGTAAICARHKITHLRCLRRVFPAHSAALKASASTGNRKAVSIASSAKRRALQIARGAPFAQAEEESLPPGGAAKTVPREGEGPPWGRARLHFHFEASRRSGESETSYFAYFWSGFHAEFPPLTLRRLRGWIKGASIETRKKPLPNSIKGMK
jgi:hypothetical protein